MSKIKYPIARHKISGKLVEILDAKNGLECNCKCFSCEEDMIAINKMIKQKPHFRHLPKSKCDANYESYVHWVAKEIFKTLDYIVLPAIYASNLDFDKNIYYSKAVNQELRNYNSKKSLLINASKKILLQSKQKIEISNFEIEKIFKSEIGNIKADIVLKFGEIDLIIEPYFTNEINELKLKKLNHIDKTTISLDLVSFIIDKGHLFKLEDLKNYIQKNTECKEWIYVRNKKRKQLEQLYITKFSGKVLNSKKEKKSYFENYNEIETLTKKIIDYEKRKKEIKAEFEYLNIQIHNTENMISEYQRLKEKALNTIANKIEKS